VRGVFFGTEERDAVFLEAVYDAFDCFPEIAGMRNSGVEHVALRVVEGTVGGASTELLA
jgi:hypothetical protein